MLRFTLKILVFITLLLGINRMGTYLMPPGWENPGYYAKLTEYKKNSQSGTSTLFFGSSRTLRHVNPVIFDSLNLKYGLPTKTYNMASSAAFFNEQFYLLDQFAQETNNLTGIRHIFVEINDMVMIHDIFLGTTRASYYITSENLGRLIRQIMAQNVSMYSIVGQSFHHIAGYVRHNLQMGHGYTRLRTVLYGKSNKVVVSERIKTGFDPISPGDTAYNNSPDLQMRNAELMRDTGYIDRNFRNMDSLHTHPIPADAYNPLVLRRYVEFIHEMKSKGIHVICLLPVSRLLTPELVSLYSALPAEHKIDMTAHPDINQLKQVKYWLDRGHLNRAGANIYTAMLSQSFVNLRIADAPQSH